MKACGRVALPLGHICASLSEGLILGIGSLEVRVGKGTGMAELDFGREHLRARAHAPGHQGLGQLLVLDCLADVVFLHTAHFSEKDNQFDVGICLVAEKMVHECGARITVATNRNTLIDT